MPSWELSCRWTLVAILAVHAGMLAWADTRQSPVNDEVAHLPAGLAYVEFGRTDMYRVNPPLVKAVAALPVVFMRPKTDWDRFGLTPGHRPDWQIGRAFATANGERVFWMFTVARWACIPFSLIGGWVCWRWAAELYGSFAGLAALGLWCFCPNILANAQLITPDTAAASFGVLGAYTFRRWLQQPNSSRMFWGGITLGLMLLAKLTWLIALPLWPLLWLAWRWRDGWPSRQDLIREAGQLVGMTGLAIFVVNAAYGFNGSFERLDEYRFVSKTLSGAADWHDVQGVGGNRFAGTWWGALRVPFPRDFILGIDVQRRDFEIKDWSFLAGEWRLGGWWYYYLYGFLVKVPLGTWLLAAIAVGVTVNAAVRPRLREQCLLIAPAAAVLILVSSQTAFNHHFRYVLPCFPFLFIWISQSAHALTRSGIARWLFLSGIASSIGASLAVYPHSGSFFNALAGGPRGGPRHLLHSNIDWGQDLLNLKRWIDRHPEARPFFLAYHGRIDPSVAGIDAPLVPPSISITQAGEFSRIVPSDPPPGWYAISVSLLYEPYSQYVAFQRLTPAAMAGYSIYIFHVAEPTQNETGMQEVR